MEQYTISKAYKVEIKRLFGFFFMLVFLMMAVAGCGKTPERAALPAPIELHISAAMGLKEVLEEIQPLYEKEHPNVKLVYNLAAAGILQNQIEQGAPADIFISASMKQLNDLAFKGMLDKNSVRKLASNELVLVAAKDSRTDWTGFQDIASEKVAKFGLGAPETVPAGEYGKEVLQYMGIWDKVKDKGVLAKDVRSIITYVESGNVEAGIVFSTVAATSDKVRIVAKAPAGSHQPIIFPGGVVSLSKHPKEAADFLLFLASEEGRKILMKYGFYPLEEKSQ